MNEPGTAPTALLVMEEERRADVYPPEVLAGIGRLVHWQGPALTRRELHEAPEVLRDVEILLTGWGRPFSTPPSCRTPLGCGPFSSRRGPSGT